MDVRVSVSPDGAAALFVEGEPLATATSLDALLETLSLSREDLLASMDDVA